MMVEVAQAVLRGAVRALRVAGLMAVAVVVSLVAAAQPSTAATSHYDLAAYTYDAPALLSSQSAAVTYVRGPPSGPGAVSRGQSAFVRDRGVAADAAGSPPPNLSPPGAGRAGAFRQAKRDSGVPVSQQPRVRPNLDRRGNLQPGTAAALRDLVMMRAG